MTKQFHRMIRIIHQNIFVASLLIACGCGIEQPSDFQDEAEPDVEIVENSGDVGAFRSLLREGKIPAPGTIDARGFFASHFIQLPSPECAQDLCLHASFGSHPTLHSGARSNIILLGLNSSIDPAGLERQPLHFAFAVDVSASMDGAPIRHVQNALGNFVAQLQAQDRVTIVAMGEAASISIEAASPTDPALAQAIASLSAFGGLNLYDGLRDGYESLARAFVENERRRVIAIVDGSASAGVTASSRIQRLASAYAAEGYGLTVVGIGAEYDIGELRELASTGGGQFVFVDEASSLPMQLAKEASVFAIPLASDLSIQIDLSPEFEFRAVYGAQVDFQTTDRVELSLPKFDLIPPLAEQNADMGRRAHDQIIVLEMESVGHSQLAVADIAFQYREERSKTMLEQSVQVGAPIGATTVSEGYFADVGTQRGFALLQVYAGFRRATEWTQRGDHAGAHALLQRLDLNLGDWLARSPDTKLAEERDYVKLFSRNLRLRLDGAPEQVLPPADPIIYP